VDTITARWAGLALALTACVLAILAGCKLDLAEENPGSTPAVSVTLAWDPAQPPVEEYRVHWGTKSRLYTHSMSAGASTQATVTGLNAGTTYYFAVTARAAGLESGYSNEVSFNAGS
jgi:hypothetical protein